MSQKARFTLQLTLRDNHGFEQPLNMAIDLDEELRISTRAVEETKMGAELGVSVMSFDAVVRLMKTKEIRKDLFRQAAIRLAGLMAERMEDAEGWHDPSRVEPARKELGGEWR
jgi:hypothetical protein